MYDVVIIGAGIAGGAIARELSRYQLKIAIVDKENDIANCTTMANSAIIHAGYDADASTNKGKYNAKGNFLYTQYCEELDVPFKRVGSLVVGFDDDDKKTIQALYENGIKNGVPEMEIIDGEKVKELEPNLSKDICVALYAPTAGIISAWEMAIALVENAMDNGVELFLNKEVVSINKSDEKFTIKFNEDEMEAKYIINCAGVHSDEINNMLAPESFKIIPRKGQYLILDKNVGDLVNRVIFQCPNKKGKGVLVAPTVHGNIIVGPDAQEIDDRDDVGTSSERLDYIKETASLSCDKIPFNMVIRSFSGVRATSNTHDFVIGESEEVKGLINVGGFESPGLSAAPAVALYVVELMKGIVGGLSEKSDFNPRRKKFVRFSELSEKEKEEVIKTNPKYGKIICRCETVTEGEIIDSIHRNGGATTVKGVKKRTRAGMGRCQGGFCEPRVVEIIARELGVNMMDVKLDSPESYILTGKTKQ